jgi:hypothetical protein
MNTGISAIIQTPTKYFDEGVGSEEYRVRDAGENGCSVQS